MCRRAVVRPGSDGPGALQPVPRGWRRSAGRCSATSIPSSSRCSTRRATGCGRCSAPTTRSRCRSAAPGSAGMEARVRQRRRARATSSSSASTACSASACATWRRAAAPTVVRVDARVGPRRSTRSALLDAHPSPKVIAVVHAETSTGVRNDVAPLGAGKGDALLLVDCVTSLGGIPVEIDGWGVDIAYSGTQKCLGVPPGLAPLTVSDRGARALRRAAAVVVPRPRHDRRLRRRRGGARTYHHTAPISMVLRAARRPRRRCSTRASTPAWARHAECGRALQEGLEKLRLRAVRRRRATGCPSSRRCGCPTASTRRPCAARCSSDYGIEIGGGARRRSRARCGASGAWATPPGLRNVDAAARARSTRCWPRERRCLGAGRPAPSAAAATNVGRFMAAHGIADVRRAACAARSTSPSGSGTPSSRFLGIAFAHALRRRCSTPATASPWATWFTGGTLEPGRRLRRPVGDADARRARRSCGRARTATSATWTLRRAARRGRRRSPRCSSGAASAPATRSASSCRCPRDRRGAAGGGQARRGLPAALLRLRRRRGRDAARGRRRQGAHHRRRHLPPRQAVDRCSHVADEAVAAVRDGAHDGRRAAARARVEQLRARGAVARPAASPFATRAGRQRAPAVHRLHVGHDRPAQGLGARARRLAGEGRRGGRLPDRRAAATTRLFWFTDMGWIMGPWEIIGAPRQRRHARALRGRARPPRARPAVGVPRAPPRHRARHQPHARSAR